MLASSPACESRSRGLRGTRSRPHAHRHRGVVGVCGTGIQSPGTEDPRCLSGQTAAWQSEGVDTKKDSRRSHTGSRTEHGEPRSTRPGRLGAALAERDTGGQGAALPRCRVPFPVLNSGRCASTRSPTSGRIRRAFNAFRGTAWMQEPCASCARREIDFGGCRCQAFALTGDARATDPVCHLAPRGIKTRQQTPPDAQHDGDWPRPLALSRSGGLPPNVEGVKPSSPRGM